MRWAEADHQHGVWSFGLQAMLFVWMRSIAPSEGGGSKRKIGPNFFFNASSPKSWCQELRVFRLKICPCLGASVAILCNLSLLCARLHLKERFVDNAEAHGCTIQLFEIVLMNSLLHYWLMHATMLAKQAVPMQWVCDNNTMCTGNTWLILPVVICLSQRLSHACPRISFSRRICKWLIISAIVSMICSYMDNCGNSRTNTCMQTRLLGRVALISFRTNLGIAWNICDL